MARIDLMRPNTLAVVPLPTAELNLDSPVLALNRHAVITKLLSQETSTAIRT